MKTFLKNWSLLTVSSFAQQLIGFFVLIRVARLLGPQSYGEYVLVLTAVGIGQTISFLGLRQIVIREIARHTDCVRSIASKVALVVGIAFVPTSVLMMIYLGFVEHLYGVFVLSMGVVLLFSQVVWNYAESLSFGKQEMQYSSTLGFAGSLVWLVAIYALPASEFSMMFVLGLFVVVQTLRSVAFIGVEWNRSYFSDRVGQHASIDTKTLLAQGLPLYGTALLSLPVMQIPILLLGLFSGKAEVAFYGIGNRLIVPLTIVSTHLMAAIYPMFAKEYVSDRAAFERYASRIFFALCLSGLIVSWILALFGTEFVGLLFGSKYAAAAHPFSVQIWVVLNLIMHSYLGTLFLASNRERLMVKLSVVNAAITGVACYFGAHYGAAGLAEFSWIGLVLSFAVHWHFIRHQVLPGFSLAKILIVCSTYVAFSIVSVMLLSAAFEIKLVLFLISVVGLYVLIRSVTTFDVASIRRILLFSKAE